MIALPFGELVALLEQVFRAHGASPEVARVMGRTVAAAERDGCLSHGLFRIPGYLSSLRSGYVDGAAVPEVARLRPGVVSADGRRGFAQAALDAAMPPLLAAARDLGIACCAIRNAHHYASLAADIEPIAERGFFVLAAVNGRSRVAPWGAERAVVGTNPLAFAAPCAEGPPFLWDMATSAVANADVLMAARDGHALPENVALDAKGRPTTDPGAVLAGGALLPFGGHKGSAIAVMVELLAAALTGGRFGFEDDAHRYPGAQTANAGQVIIVIDPGAAGAGSAAERVQDLLGVLASAGVRRIPGDKRHAARTGAAEGGVPVPPETLARLRDHATGTVASPTPSATAST